MDSDEFPIRRRRPYAADSPSTSTESLPLDEQEQDRVVKRLARQHQNDVLIWRYALAGVSLGIFGVGVRRALSLPGILSLIEILLLTIPLLPTFLDAVILLNPQYQDTLKRSFFYDISPLLPSSIRSAFSHSSFKPCLIDCAAILAIVFRAFLLLFGLYREDEKSEHPVIQFIVHISPAASLCLRYLASYWETTTQHDIAELQHLRYPYAGP